LKNSTIAQGILCSIVTEVSVSHFYDCALANDKLCGNFQLPCATLVSLLSNVTNAISMRKDQQSKKKKISDIFKTLTILQELAKRL